MLVISVVFILVVDAVGRMFWLQSGGGDQTLGSEAVRPVQAGAQRKEILSGTKLLQRQVLVSPLLPNLAS